MPSSRACRNHCEHPQTKSLRNASRRQIRSELTHQAATGIFQSQQLPSCQEAVHGARLLRAQPPVPTRYRGANNYQYSFGIYDPVVILGIWNIILLLPTVHLAESTMAHGISSPSWRSLETLASPCCFSEFVWKGRGPL